MKNLASIALSCIALAGLTFGAVAHATDVSRRPLRVDINVKPNVIFGMDDSGSMDWEILISADGGALNWSDYTRSYWSGNGFLAVGTIYMSYLFPVGTGTGGNNYAEDYGQYAVPPSPQFAPVRSAAYNPLYYNPAVTYVPWATAYHGGRERSYDNAVPTAAKSHPAIAGSVTMNLTANQTYSFNYEAGMRLPNGTVATRWGFVSTTYFPATYWVLDSDCVASNVWTSTCVQAPDGRKLRKYEIKSGNTFPSGRSYADELQNFANWWSYYRKRKLMLAGAMGTVLDDLTGMRLGVINFNDRGALAMYDADGTDSASNRRRIAGAFYTNPAIGGTPTAGTLNAIGQQYMTGGNVIQYSCQRNNAFIVTDGFANDTYTPPAYDATRFGSGAPYQTITRSSIADVALAYFTLNLRNGRTASAGGATLSDGRVPLTNQDVKNPDRNQNLHMNTYAITLGARGTIWPGIADPFSTAFTWPAPVADTAASIDDLWHATINGRGQMYVADDPRQAANNIREGLNDMVNQTGSQSAVAVSSQNLARSDGRAYMGLYTTGSFGGDVAANALDTSTGAMSSRIWSAADRLNQRTAPRLISTYKSPFTEAAAGPYVSTETTGRSALLAYLRGSRADEGTTYRRRTSLMGAVINAKPVVTDKVVYAASGEGMLHAFDTDTGDELWAYVPRFVLGSMAATAARNYYFETLLDGTPSVAALSTGQKVLIAGRGSAGPGYYALDISAPRPAMSEQERGDTALWEITDGGSFVLGQSVGRPVIVNTKTHGWVALITQGYNGSTDGKGRLYMVNASTGALLRTFTVSGDSGGDLGLAQVSAAVEPNGLAIHAYGGDLQGNLWHFDLEDGTTRRMATFMVDGRAQPITAAPEIALVDKRRIVLVGTGRMLGMTDFGATTTQSLYAIKDDGSTLAAGAVRSALLKREISTNGTVQTMTGTDLDWAQKSGWYFDLPSNLQVTSAPAAAYGGVTFTGNKASTSDCWAASSLFVIDFATGKNLGKSTWVMATLSERSASSGPVVLNPLPPPPPQSCVTDCTSPPSTPCANVVKSDGSTECKEIDPGAGVRSRRDAWRQIRRGDR